MGPRRGLEGDSKKRNKENISRTDRKGERKKKTEIEIENRK